MKRETLRQILALSKDEKSAAEVLDMIKNYEQKYEDGTDGTTIKLRVRRKSFSRRPWRSALALRCWKTRIIF